jgi:hypothetical protein
MDDALVGFGSHNPILTIFLWQHSSGNDLLCSSELKFDWS